MAQYNFKYTYQQFPKWTDTAEGMEIIQADPDFVRVCVLPDVTYAVKDGIELHIRIMIPESSDNRPFPFILHVKGSGWEIQNLSGSIGDFAHFVKMGYGVGIMQYRTVRQAKYPAQVHDLKSAARYIAAHHEELNIDISNFFISGDSSGGHTAVMGYLTWNTDLLDSPQEKDPLPALRGLIDCYGVTDLKALCSQETGLSRDDNALLADMLFTTDIPYEEQFPLADYHTFIDLRNDKEPILILHGNKDRLVPLSQSTELYSDLKKRGIDCSLLMVDGADHGHNLLWGPQTIERTLRFLKENTK
ncbi:MAG: alpha/beta hydrolase [Erysipelotrichaceae bacterium]|nr:alpha/beta hydrolase [Erysipelotrichaceae bacterium]